MSTGNLPNLVAIDLGAESCRVSLLQWRGETPHIRLVTRFANAPVSNPSGMRWDLDGILRELEKALRRAADVSSGPIAAIGVDGWAVDYVRLRADGLPIAQPFCYRDSRTEATETAFAAKCSKEELFKLTGVQPLRINSVYQLMADQVAGISPQTPWVNLPEYVLARLGGCVVAEFSNATHTGLVDIATRDWSPTVFELSGLSLDAAPKLVLTGMDLGKVEGALQQIKVFAETRLIAPACHDTASAVAGIALDGGDWAYISSGTWSLVGTVLEKPIKTTGAFAAGFTNFGAAGGRVCFHKNVNGMWLLRQAVAQLCPRESTQSIPELIAAAEEASAPEGIMDVDDPALWMQGKMASRINEQRVRRGMKPIPEDAEALPQFASLIFHSLADRYATVLAHVRELTGKKLTKLAIVGGGSRNQFLNRLTEDATGLPVHCGAAESSTVGNFAVQLASLEGAGNSPERTAHWARTLIASNES